MITVKVFAIILGFIALSAACRETRSAPRAGTVTASISSAAARVVRVFQFLDTALTDADRAALRDVRLMSDTDARYRFRLTARIAKNTWPGSGGARRRDPAHEGIALADAAEHSCRVHLSAK